MFAFLPDWQNCHFRFLFMFTQFCDLGKIWQILNILGWKLSHKWQNGLSCAYMSCEITVWHTNPLHISISGYILSWLDFNLSECQPVWCIKREHCVLQFKPWSFPVPLNLLSAAKSGKCSINTCRGPTSMDQSRIVRFLLFT